ncbi:MAG TPA: HD domain-containing protein [Desulfonatronum sp.]|nr:HD domain-containing protein [Desulfonatronum sp.]
MRIDQCREKYQDSLQDILSIFSRLRELRGMDAILDRILLEARKLCRAEAGSIFLVKGDHLVFSIVHNDSLFDAQGIDKHIYHKSTLPVDDYSIAGYTANRGKTLVIDDVYTIDPSYPFCFNPAFDKLTGYLTKSILSLPLINFQGHVCAVLQLINALDEHGSSKPFSPGCVSMVSLLSNHAAACIETGMTNNELILRSIRMSELRDPAETGPHVERVGAYSAEIYHRIAQGSGLEASEIKRRKDLIRLAAMLHDVGKVGISDAILKKPGRLTSAEYVIMKRHTLYGGHLFRNATSELDILAGTIALNHHQRFDGNGYPGRISDVGSLDAQTVGVLKGEDIPLSARIVALADVFDALTSKRAYKEPWPLDRAVEFLRCESGKQFDPIVVDAFLSILDVIGAIQAKYQETST